MEQSATKAKTSAAEQAKAWRARMEVENPEYMDLQRAKARDRANATRLAKKDDPEHSAKIRARQREYARKRRANPEISEAIKQANRLSRLKPENIAKQAARMKDWREANKDKIKSYQAQWKQHNAEAISQYVKEYMAEYGKRDAVVKATHARHLKKYYQMTPEDFNALWDEQSGVCAVCNIAMAPRGRKSNSACVDHNHETGEIRGLLCRACNHGIGNLKDNPETLMRAAEYLLNRGFYGKQPIDIKEEI